MTIKKATSTCVKRAVITLGLLLGVFVGNASAGLMLNDLFALRRGNSVVNANYAYGVSGQTNAIVGNQMGQSSFVTFGGDGYNFFVLFNDNSGNSNNNLNAIGGSNWGASGLATYFPPGGLTAAPTITSILAGVTVGSLTMTHVAPVGGLSLSSWNSDGFSTVTNAVAINNGAKVGYMISLGSAAATVPEPSSFAVLAGGVAVVASWRRRKKATQSGEAAAV